MEIISLAMITTLTLVCIFLVLYRYINDCKSIAIVPDAPGNLIWKLLGSFIPILHLFIIYREAKKLC